MIPTIIDTDPGIDDAVALAAALFHTELDIRLITTVAGNVPVEKTTRNALRLLEFWGRKIPVAAGAAKPLLRPRVDASDIHGDSGLDGFDFPEPAAAPLAEHAVCAMHRVLEESAEPVTIVELAPQTNLALLLGLYPQCAGKIARIVMMGGSTGRGNYTPCAEFNIYADPEAARAVFHSGVPITMCGLNVTNQAILNPLDISRLSGMNRTGAMFCRLFAHYRGGSMATGLKMHDLCAVACLLRPELFTRQDTFVEVETAGEFTAGCTAVDLKNYWGRTPNASVALEINQLGLCKWLMETIGRMP